MSAIDYTMSAHNQFLLFPIWKEIAKAYNVTIDVQYVKPYSLRGLVARLWLRVSCFNYKSMGHEKYCERFNVNYE